MGAAVKKLLGLGLLAGALVAPSWGQDSGLPSANEARTNVSNNFSVAQTMPLLNAPNWGTVFFADGFVSALYPGIGQATQAYSSSANVPLCQSVSHSGNYYLAMNATNASTTPGTNLAVWWPVPQTGATTQMDCAWYTAEAAKHANHVNQLIIDGAAIYSTNGMVDYVDGDSYDDEFAVSIAGVGPSGSYIQYTGAANIPVISRPSGGGNYASMNLRDLTIDGGGVASADYETDSSFGFYFNASAGHVAPGSDHDWQFGATSGGSQEILADLLTAGVYPDQMTPNCGVFTANVVGGSVTSYTVNTAGTCYSAATAGNVYYVQLTGYGSSGTATQPCTTMPAGQTVTLSGSGVASISEGSNSGGSGCGGTIYVQVYSGENVNYGFVLHNSDSHMDNLISYAGILGGFYIDGGLSTYTKLHPSVIPNGIINAASGDGFVGTELDDVFNRGFTFQQPFATQAASVVGTTGWYGGFLFPGASTYYFASSSAAVNFAASSSLKDNGAGATGWQEFVTQSGPIVQPSDYAAKAPTGMSVTGNDTTAGQAMGDWQPTMNTANLTATNATIGTLTAGSTRYPEYSAPSNSSGQTSVYADSTNHELEAATNGSSTFGILNRTVAKVHGTGLTASVSTATLCAASAGACNVAGQYRISISMIETGTACSSVTAGSVIPSITWTDTNGTSHAAVIPQLLVQSSATATSYVSTGLKFATSLANSGASGELVISTNGSVVQYATTYIACTTGTGTYQIDLAAVRLQ